MYIKIKWWWCGYDNDNNSDDDNDNNNYNYNNNYNNCAKSQHFTAKRDSILLFSAPELHLKD